MVLVSEVSKTRLKSPSHEITLGFRMSGRILSAVATSAVVALIVSVVVVVIVVGRGNDDGAGINESVTGETSGETALAATPESKIVNSWEIEGLIWTDQNEKNWPKLGVRDFLASQYSCRSITFTWKREKLERKEMKEKQNKKTWKEEERECWVLNKEMKFKLVVHNHLDSVLHWKTGARLKFTMLVGRSVCPFHFVFLYFF